MVEVEWLRSHDLPPGEGQQLVSEISGPARCSFNLLYVLVGDLPVLTSRFGGCFRYFLADEGGIVGNDAEQVVEVVGYPSGQLAETLQSLALMHLGFEFLALDSSACPFKFEVLPIDNVPEDHDRAD